MKKENLIKQELIKTTIDSHYNGWHNRRTKFGYHSYDLDEIKIEGQRGTKKRIDNFKNHISFENKKVIDFGCNVGAILHHLPELKKGLGFDYDHKCIDAANNINKILEIDNLCFLVHDFDKEPYECLLDKIDFKPDFIFLLSLGSWVKSWKKLYKICIEFNCTIILEINNKEEGLEQIEFFKDNNFKLKEIIESSSDDITGNLKRKTYIVTKNED